MKTAAKIIIGGIAGAGIITGIVVMYKAMKAKSASSNSTPPVIPDETTTGGGGQGGFQSSPSNTGSGYSGSGTSVSGFKNGQPLYSRANSLSYYTTPAFDGKYIVANTSVGMDKFVGWFEKYATPSKDWVQVSVYLNGQYVKNYVPAAFVRAGIASKGEMLSMDGHRECAGCHMGVDGFNNCEGCGGTCGGKEQKGRLVSAMVRTPSFNVDGFENMFGSQRPAMAMHLDCTKSINCAMCKKLDLPCGKKDSLNVDGFNNLSGSNKKKECKRDGGTFIMGDCYFLRENQ